MKYVLYEGEAGDMLFAKEVDVAKNPNVLEHFANKVPTWSIEADDDSSAVTLLNAHMMARSVQK